MSNTSLGLNLSVFKNLCSNEEKLTSFLRIG